MAGFGPPPKPDGQRRRRNAPMGGQVKRIPATGRQGAAPPLWPYRRPTKALLTLWERLWSKPQALMWEQVRCEDVVARYVLLLAAGAELTEIRQLEDRLGLTPMAMLRLRWEVVDDDVAEPELPQLEEGVVDIRHRLQAVDE